jgi:hypothetical protein
MRISCIATGVLLVVGGAIYAARYEGFTGEGPSHYIPITPESITYLRHLNEALQRGKITFEQFQEGQNYIIHGVRNQDHDLPLPDFHDTADASPSQTVLDELPGETEDLIANTHSAEELAAHRTLMDSWLNFVTKNYSPGGPSAEKRPGFVSGGQKYRDNLQPVADSFGAAMGIKPKAVGDDKIDFGDGFGPIDVITASGDWWYSN